MELISKMVLFDWYFSRGSHFRRFSVGIILSPFFDSKHFRFIVKDSIDYVTGFTRFALLEVLEYKKAMNLASRNIPSEIR